MMMDDSEIKSILGRIAAALERIAARYAPEKGKTEIRSATLSRATYTREEREFADFKAGIRHDGPPGAPVASVRVKQ
jgi:hypothetical protein